MGVRKYTGTHIPMDTWQFKSHSEGSIIKVWNYDEALSKEAKKIKQAIFQYKLQVPL